MIERNFFSSAINAHCCGDFTISATDRLFVSVIQFGTTVKEFAFSGIASMAELMSTVISRLSTLEGVITLNLRNGSQGQRTKKVIRLGGNGRALPSIKSVERMPEATQLRLAI